MQIVEREIIQKFKEWKNSINRKPVLLMGARQIGKTWAMVQFGKEAFTNYVKFDFDKQTELHSIFQNTKSPDRILKELSFYCDDPIIAGETLIIFDEIQECEQALNSLKYFCDEAPQYHIIAAGSLLGVAVRRRKMTVPVGKVEVMRMYPISFNEFLKASDPQTYKFVIGINTIEHLPAVILNKLKLEYKRYQICGGMPEAVVSLLDNKGIAEVETILQTILDLYELDFSKYAEPIQITRIRAVWHSLPSQLAKENRKFLYKVIKSGARSKDYEDALTWLEDAGMIYRVYNITKPNIPLEAYKDISAFKIYACDCGLLRRLARLSASAITDKLSNYTEFKGALAENFVLQSLVPICEAQVPLYWSSESTAEIEFVIQWENKVIPIEVKAEGNVNGNSLSVYTKKYQADQRIRFSSLNLQYNSGLLSCPVALVGNMAKLLEIIEN